MADGIAHTLEGLQGGASGAFGCVARIQGGSQGGPGADFVFGRPGAAPGATSYRPSCCLLTPVEHPPPHPSTHSPHPPPRDRSLCGAPWAAPAPPTAPSSGLMTTGRASGTLLGCLSCHAASALTARPAHLPPPHVVPDAAAFLCCCNLPLTGCFLCRLTAAPAWLRAPIIVPQGCAGACGGGVHHPGLGARAGSVAAPALPGDEGGCGLWERVWGCMCVGWGGVWRGGVGEWEGRGGGGWVRLGPVVSGWASAGIGESFG